MHPGLKNGALIAVTAAGLGIGGSRLGRLLSNDAAAPSGPVRLEETEGRRMPDWMTGADSAAPDAQARATVVYVFTTTCPACERQRVAIGRLLAGLPANQVVTVAPEPPALIARYWLEVGIELGTPLAVPPASLMRLGIRGTPTLLFLDQAGVARRVWIGATHGWGRADFLRELREAKRAGSEPRTISTPRARGCTRRLVCRTG